MIFKPTDDYILIKEHKLDNVTDSGIILTNENNSTVYKIVGFGDNFKSDELKIGDIVVCRSLYNGNSFIHEGVTHHFVKFEQIMAVLD